MRKTLVTACLLVLTLNLSAQQQARQHVVPRTVATPGWWSNPASIIEPLALGVVPTVGLIADLGPGQSSTMQWSDSTGNGNDCIFPTPGSQWLAPTFVDGLLVVLGEPITGNGEYEGCLFPEALSTTARTVEFDVYLPTMTEASEMNDCYTDNAAGCTIYNYYSLLGTSSPYGVQLELSNGSQTPSSPLPVRTSYFPNIMGNYAQSTSSATPVIGWNHIVFVSGCASDGTFDQVYVNGVPANVPSDELSNQSCTATNTNTGAWTLGDSASPAGTGALTARFEHMRAWDRVLSSNEIAELNRASQVEWAGLGISTAVPNNFVNGSATLGIATLTITGDSQSKGTPQLTGDQEWNSPSNLTLPGGYSSWNIFNRAVSGMTADSIQGEVAFWGAQNTSTAVAQNVLIDYSGIDDTYFSHSLPPAALQVFKLYIASQARSTGFSDVFEVTLSDWNGLEPAIQQVNENLISASTLSLQPNPAPTYIVVDMAGDPYFGSTGAYADASRFEQGDDCCHFTAYGESILGGYVSNVVASAFGNTAGSPTLVSSATPYQMLNSDNFVRCTLAGCAIQLPDCTGYQPGHTRTIIVDAGASASITSAPANVSGSPVSVNGATAIDGETVTYTVQHTPLQTWSQGWTPAAGCSWN